jgi:ribonuclease HI
LPQTEVDLSLLEKRQKEGSYETEVYNVREYIGSRYGEYLHIFTDASKDSKTDHVGSAFIIPKIKVYKNKRISDCLSVYTGEMFAIIMAIRWIREVKISKAVICSDCSSALISLKEMKSETRQDMVIEIIQELYSIKQDSLEVQFLWVPAHIGLRGNEEADALAKKATEREIVDIQILFSRSEIKSIIKKNIMKKWQLYWDNEIKGRHMYQIQSTVGKGRISGRRRYEENMITRLRLGHTRLNSTLHLISKHPTGLCEVCEVSETIEHVLMKCRRYNVERKELKEKLNNIGVKFTILNVLKSDRSIINLMIEYLGNTGLNKRI